MTDLPDSPGLARPLPAFTPVPVRARRDGWTAQRQEEFLRALAVTLCVDKAARQIGMSRESAYRLRGRAGAESFAAAWDRVLAPRPVSGLTEHALLWHRAFFGTLKPITRKGRRVATLHRPDDGALLTLLRRFARATRQARAKVTMKFPADRSTL